ncbi:hypothetical protein PLUTE_a3998 [Pseudoalteromonas luteoviolacea DSM 6061]|nr:hypothetical protein [Pseudoalteromonas luteoviolacea DSM 6061]
MRHISIAGLKETTKNESPTRIKQRLNVSKNKTQEEILFLV